MDTVHLDHTGALEPSPASRRSMIKALGLVIVGLAITLSWVMVLAYGAAHLVIDAFLPG